jgi:hypothetical protein
MELLFYDNYISGNWIDGDDVIRGEGKYSFEIQFDLTG